MFWWTFRSTFVLFRALFDITLLRNALRFHFLVLKPVARWVGFTKITKRNQWLCGVRDP